MRGLLRLMGIKLLQRTDDMLPAKVIAYNKATNLATIQPMIMVVTTDGQSIARAQVAAVPVYKISSGGFIINFPVKPGDLGWIKANDRDISSFVSTYAMASPNTQRKHSFKDAMFYPQAAWDLVSISEEDSANLVLQNYAGTCKISISETNVTVTAPNGVLFDTPVATFTGIIDVQNNNGESTPCTVNGNIVTNGDVIASGTSLHTHKHGGVMTGGGDTGVPI